MPHYSYAFNILYFPLKCFQWLDMQIIKSFRKDLKLLTENSLAVYWWLGLGTFAAIGCGLIPGHRTRILQAVWHCHKKKKKNTVLLSVSSVAQSCLTLCPHGLQHARLPCPSPTPGAYSNSCPLSWWCHPTILSSVIPFSSHLQSFPASGSFPMSQFFTSGGQSMGVSASASVLPVNIQGWFPLGLTGLISLQSKRLSRVFSNTTVQKHPFFGAQLSL